MFIEGRAASVAFPFFILMLTCMGIFCKIFYDSGMLVLKNGKQEAMDIRTSILTKVVLALRGRAGFALT